MYECVTWSELMDWFEGGFGGFWCAAAASNRPTVECQVSESAMRTSGFPHVENIECEICLGDYLLCSIEYRNADCVCWNSRSALHTNSVSWTVNINASLPSIIRISHVSYWWGVVRSGQWILQFDVELSRWFPFRMNIFCSWFVLLVRLWGCSLMSDGAEGG